MIYFTEKYLHLLVTKVTINALLPNRKNRLPEESSKDEYQKCQHKE